MASELVLYDLASSVPGRAWSLNTLKTRLALNYKGLDYETKWLEFQEIAPTLESSGIPLNKEGTAYTVPTIKTASGNHIMDSVAIAEYLESEYTAPKYPVLQFNAERLSEVQATTGKLLGPLFPIFAPLIFGELISPGSVDYVNNKYGGNPSLAKADDTEAAWEGARPGLTALASLLKEKDGPFFEGFTRSHSDLIVVSLFHMLSLPKNQDPFNRLLSFDPAFKTLYEEYLPYTKRSDQSTGNEQES